MNIAQHKVLEMQICMQILYAKHMNANTGILIIEGVLSLKNKQKQNSTGQGNSSRV